MKKSEIGKGRIYSDGKAGLREVLDVGPQYKLYEAVQDCDCLRYRCLGAKVATEIGKGANSTRTAFAAWAKVEIPAAQVHLYLIRLQTEKVAGKLSEPQRQVLRTFDSDLVVGASVECPRAEYRVAKACFEKGIITEIQLDAGAKWFDVSFTPMGLSVLAQVLGQQACSWKTAHQPCMTGQPT